jgi:hypothetical protein
MDTNIPLISSKFLLTCLGQNCKDICMSRYFSQFSCLFWACFIYLFKHKEDDDDDDDNYNTRAISCLCEKNLLPNTKSRIEQSLGSGKHFNASCKSRRHLPVLTMFNSLLADGKSVSLFCISCWHHRCNLWNFCHLIKQLARPSFNFQP